MTSITSSQINTQTINNQTTRATKTTSQHINLQTSAEVCTDYG